MRVDTSDSDAKTTGDGEVLTDVCGVTNLQRASFEGVGEEGGNVGTSEV